MSLFARLTEWLGRLRARWYRWRGLPTVAQLLADGTGLPAAPTRALPPAGQPLVPESPDSYPSIPSTVALVAGRPAPTFPVAAVRILPPEPPSLVVLRPEQWPLAPPLGPTRDARRPSPGEDATTLSAVRVPAPLVRTGLDLSRFGLAPDATSTRLERRAPAARATHRPALRLNLARRAARTPPVDFAVLDPTRFGLLDDGRTPLEENAITPRVARRLPPAVADFHARWISPARPMEGWGLQVPRTFGESVRERSGRFFEASTLGARPTARERERPEGLDDAMEEVREQFLLRRDAEKLELDEDDVGRLTAGARQPEAIRSFTGIEFMDLDPEPFEPLKLRLTHPGPDLSPLVEPLESRIAALVAAIREDRPDEPDTPA